MPVFFCVGSWMFSVRSPCRKNWLTIQAQWCVPWRPLTQTKKCERDFWENEKARSLVLLFLGNRPAPQARAQEKGTSEPVGFAACSISSGTSSFRKKLAAANPPLLRISQGLCRRPPRSHSSSATQTYDLSCFSFSQKSLSHFFVCVSGRHGTHHCA